MWLLLRLLYWMVLLLLLPHLWLLLLLVPILFKTARQVAHGRSSAESAGNQRLGERLPPPAGTKVVPLGNV